MKKMNLLRVFAIVGIISVFAACRKDPQPNPVIEPNPVDSALVKLKEYTVTNLPAPYYHFTYDNNGYAKTIDFASGLLQYELEYENKRLKTMTSLTTGERRVYEYTNGRVTLINGFEIATGKKITHNTIAYNQQGRLSKIEWFIYNDNGPDAIIDQVAEIVYNTDGNIRQYTIRYPDENGQLSFSSTYTFDDYDNGTNVESFGMFKDFFDHIIYLPGIKIQKNNPRKGRIIGSQNEFEINYAYSYHSNNLPKSKVTTIKKIRGDNVGHVTTSTTEFSYY